MLNESIIMLVEQGVEELSLAQITFGMKIMIIFGFVFLFQTLGKTGGSLLNLLVYVYAFFKWLIFKIRGKEI